MQIKHKKEDYENIAGIFQQSVAGSVYEPLCKKDLGTNIFLPVGTNLPTVKQLSATQLGVIPNQTQTRSGTY